MLTELYIEALLVDEALADEVWVLWNARVNTDDVAAWAWWLVGAYEDWPACCFDHAKMPKRWTGLDPSEAVRGEPALEAVGAELGAENDRG